MEISHLSLRERWGTRHYGDFCTGADTPPKIVLTFHLCATRPVTSKWPFRTAINISDQISGERPVVPGFPTSALRLRRRALTGRINPTNINKNIIVFIRRIRGQEKSFRHAAANHSRQSRKTRGWLTTSDIIMGNAQTHTMTAIMTHATRFPAANPVQIIMSATIMTVREAKP
jgi:hypothetical protein